MNKKYKLDYELRDEPRPNGRTRLAAVYTGAYWSYHLEPRQYRALRVLLLGTLCLMSAAYVAMGLLRTGSMGFGGPAAPYVLLPYAALLLPLGMCWGKTLVMPAVQRPLERREYEQGVRGRRGWSTALLVCAAAAFLGGGMYALLHRGTATAAHDLLFLLLTAALGALDWFFIRVQDRYPCTKEEK